MSPTADLHALAKARAQCAQRVADLERHDLPMEPHDRATFEARMQAAKESYQEAEDSYQRAIGTLTNHELINLGLAP